MLAFKEPQNTVMKKTHSRNIHIGNQGEHIVAAMLSANCIVREVGQGKDSGIDLYCEILSPNTLELSIHFFCQVKTVKGRFNLSSIEDKYFEYWGSQPSPAFLFVVEYSDEGNIHGDHKIWVYDIPYILAIRDAKSLGKEVPKRDVKERFELCGETNNRDKMSLGDFLYGHVSWAHGLWQMRRFGLVYPNPEIVEQTRLQYFVGGFTYLYEEKINDAIYYAKQIMHWDKNGKSR